MRDLKHSDFLRCASTAFSSHCGPCMAASFLKMKLNTWESRLQRYSWCVVSVRNRHSMEVGARLPLRIREPSAMRVMMGTNWRSVCRTPS
jgi:hypothetical protein